MISSRKEIRDSILTSTRMTGQGATIQNLVDDLINVTLSEINDPGWAFGRKAHTHLWSFLRRKTSFSVDSEDYVLGRDIDRIALVRQTDSPVKLDQVPDEDFYWLVPNPTSTGNPRFYRLWEEEGVSARLSSAATLKVVSDSASDAGSSELAVSVQGYVGGIWQYETFELNGTAEVTGSKTFQAREIFVSKQKDTTGTITVKDSSDNALVTLAPDERMAKFKIMSFYPIPSSAITIYVEFYSYIPHLENDSDVPIFHQKWHYVVRLGALAKFQRDYLNKEESALVTQNMYASAVRAMVSSDKTNPDLIEHLNPRRDTFPFIHIKRAEDVTVT